MSLWFNSCVPPLQPSRALGRPARAGHSCLSECTAVPSVSEAVVYSPSTVVIVGNADLHVCDHHSVRKTPTDGG